MKSATIIFNLIIWDKHYAVKVIKTFDKGDFMITELIAGLVVYGIDSSLKKQKLAKKEMEKRLKEEQKRREREEKERRKAYEKNIKELEKARSLREKEKLKREIEEYKKRRENEAIEDTKNLLQSYEEYNQIYNFVIENKEKVELFSTDTKLDNECLERVELVNEKLIPLLKRILAQKEIVEYTNHSFNYFIRHFNNGEEKSIEVFMNVIMNRNNFFDQFLESYECQYEAKSRKAYILLHFKNKENIFPYKSVKYLKTKDYFDVVDMGVTEQSSRLEELMANIILSIVEIFYCNNFNQYFNNLFIHAFTENRCIETLRITKQDYFLNQQDIKKLIIQAESFKRGIPEYESKYVCFEGSKL